MSGADRRRLEHYAAGVGGVGSSVSPPAGPDPLHDEIRRLDERNVTLRNALWQVYKMHGGISTAETPDGISDYDLMAMATNQSCNGRIGC